MPDLVLEILPVVAAHFRTVVTSLLCRVLSIARSCATAPATWGHAMEVPDMYIRAVSEDAEAALMEEPGA